MSPKQQPGAELASRYHNSVIRGDAVTLVWLFSPHTSEQQLVRSAVTTTASYLVDGPAVGDSAAVTPFDPAQQHPDLSQVGVLLAGRWVRHRVAWTV